MKRNILLGFLLIGLVVMEWGCMGSACGEQRYHADDIQLVTQTFRGETIINRPIKYDSLVFVFDVNSTEVSIQNNKMSFSVYACDPFFFLENEITKVEVSTSTEYSSTQSETELFAQNLYGYIDFDSLWVQDSTYASSLLLDETFGFRGPFQRQRLSLAYPPIQTDTFQFTFQFFDTEGNIFETTTDPIIVTP